MSAITDLELKTANIFWEAFIKREAEITQLIKTRLYDNYQLVRDIFDDIIDTAGLCDKINILFGIDVRNGVELAERKDHIEMIITPLCQRKNKRIAAAIYHEHKKYVPISWTVIKYKFWQPSYINTIVLNYRDGDELVEVDKNDFQFMPIIDKTTSKLNILLFVADSKAKYLIKKEKYDSNEVSRDIWIPVDCSIYSILDSAIGEYHLLNTLDKMEIYLTSEEAEITERQPIEKLADIVTMIANNPMSGIYTCARCGYSNKQAIIKACKCKNVYYCDTICQRAHRELHKPACI